MVGHMQQDASRPAQRIPFSAWLPWLPWLLGGALVIILFARDYMRSQTGLIVGEVFWGRDFINMWTGGQLVREGQLALIYDLDRYAEYLRTLFGEIADHNYSYPPVTFPIAAALSTLSYPVALAVWLTSTGALFIAAARQWWPERSGPYWLAVLTPAALVNIWAGHYGFLIGALFLLGFRALADERPVRAGLFFGLMLIKPHLALLIPVVLAVRREWLAILSAALTVATLVVITTLLYGWEPWHQFLFRTSGVQASMIEAGDSFFGNMSPSFATAASKLGAAMPLALTIQAAAAVPVVAVTVAAAASREVALRDLALLVATGTFLVLPYSFNYDMTVVMIAALWVLSGEDRTEMERRLALYGLLAPQVGMLCAMIGVPLMPLMVAGLFTAQASVLFRSRACHHASIARPSTP